MKSKCQITFEGLNINRTVTLLSKRGVTIYNVERIGKKCSIQVPSTCAKQTIALLREKCYNIIDIEYFGASALLKFAQKRYVFVLVCLVCIALLAAASQFCFKIVVVGDFDTEAVMQALENKGVKIGCNLAKVNVDAIENEIANEMSAMYAVAKRSGSVFYINVVSNKHIDAPIEMSKRRDIVATRSGTVTSLLCEQGTALVKVGDYVNKGDVLIEGRRIYNDGTSDDVYSLGRVVLQISVSAFVEFDGYKTTTVQTGNTYTSTGVVLFGKEYVRSCPFAEYVVDTQIAWLNPLKLEIHKNTYKEIKTERIEASLSECLAELQASAYMFALENCDFTITDVQYLTQDNKVFATLLGNLYIE